MALILSEVAVNLGGRRVLDDIHARFEAGRITVVLGPNGAGKSTLLRATTGLIGRSGDVTVDGIEVATLSPRARAREIGYLPQDHNVHWDVTVGELVALGRAPYRLPFAAASDGERAAVAAAMHATDTADFAERRVMTLSGGERARVLLARVLAGQPRWLLADEPLASLDPAHQIALLDRLRAVADTGVGVVLVLHDLTQAARVADDVLVLDDGRIGATTLDPAVIARVFEVEAAWVDAGGVRRLVIVGPLAPA